METRLQEQPALDPTVCERASRAGYAVVRMGLRSAVELVKVTRTLGEPMFTPGEVPHPEHPQVFVVTNRGRSDTPRSVFHSDTSYVERPPSWTLLAGISIPSTGGETLFVNQLDAWQSASDALRADLHGVEFLHVASRVPKPDEAGDGCWHPVIRRHPLTGSEALYVSAQERLVAARRYGQPLTAADSHKLIDRACRQAQYGAPTARHRWSRGDLLLTDNRSTLHAADHSAVVGERTLYRVMVRGERPIAAWQ